MERSTRIFHQIVVACSILSLSFGVYGCSENLRQRQSVPAVTYPSETPLHDDTVCGVVSNSYLKDRMSFVSRYYTYDNYRGNGDGQGVFKCRLASISYPDSSPFIWVKFNNSRIIHGV